MAENRITSALCSLYRITSCRKRQLTAYAAFVIHTCKTRLLMFASDCTFTLNINMRWSDKQSLNSTHKRQQFYFFNLMLGPL